jgi:hypothetical protein
MYVQYMRRNIRGAQLSCTCAKWSLRNERFLFSPRNYALLLVCCAFPPDAPDKKRAIGGVESVRMESRRKWVFHKTGITQNGKTQNGKT